MTLCTADFELGADGQTITTSDPGSATAWNTVSIGTSGAIVYSSVQKIGTLSARISRGASSGQSYLDWLTALGTVTDHYGRIYVNFENIDPTQNTDFVWFNGPTGHVTLRRNSSTGFLALVDRPGTSTIGTLKLPLGVWMRIEWHIIHSLTVGQMISQSFIDSNMHGTTPDETITSVATLDTMASANEGLFGMLATRSNFSLYVDSIVSGAAAFPGPETTQGRSARNYSSFPKEIMATLSAQGDASR